MWVAKPETVNSKPPCCWVRNDERSCAGRPLTWSTAFWQMATGSHFLSTMPVQTLEASGIPRHPQIDSSIPQIPSIRDQKGFISRVLGGVLVVCRLLSMTSNLLATASSAGFC